MCHPSGSGHYVSATILENIKVPTNAEFSHPLGNAQQAWLERYVATVSIKTV